MRVLSILKKDLTILLRSRAEMAILFLMPLAFILPISFALGSGDGYGINRANNKILVPVIDYDGGARALDLTVTIGESLAPEREFNEGLLRNLGAANMPECEAYMATLQDEETEETGTPTASGTVDAAAETLTPAVSETPAQEETAGEQPPLTIPAQCAEKAARAMLQRSWRTAAIIIPPGFSAAVDAGEPVEVSLLYDPAGDSVRMQQIEGVVKGATVKISLQNQLAEGLGQMADLTMFAPENVRGPMQAEAEDPQPVEGQQPAIRLEKVSPESVVLRATPDTYQQTIPGYTVMYVFFIITTLTSAIRAERINGTFRRLLSMPVSRGSLLISKLLAAIVIGVAQVLLLFAVGALVFGLGLGSSPLTFLLLTVVLVACAAALGIAVSTTRIKGAGLGAPLVIAALLGGCMFPPDLMPPFLRAISYTVPHRWALNGYQNLLVRGLGFEQVAPQIAVLLAFTAVFFLFAVIRFDFVSQEE